MAKEKGVHLGRPGIVYPPNWEEVYQQWEDKQITAVEAMKILGLKRSTFYKLVSQVRSRRHPQTSDNFSTGR